MRSKELTVALLDLDFDKHLVYKTKVSSKQDSFVITTVLRPEIVKWMSEHAVRYQLIIARNSQICILDNQKAMLFKLTWM